MFFSLRAANLAVLAAAMMAGTAHARPACCSNMNSETLVGTGLCLVGDGLSSAAACTGWDIAALGAAVGTPPGYLVEFPFWTPDFDNGAPAVMTGFRLMGDCCLTDICTSDRNDGTCLIRFNSGDCPASHSFFQDYYGQFLPNFDAGCTDDEEVYDMMDGSDGDPHVKTWGRNWFDYMGECDLVLIHSPDFDQEGRDLDIHIRTTIRHDYSFIESAAVRIGDDTLEVSSFGSYALNGVETPESDGNLKIGKYDIHHTQENKKRHSFDVVLSPHQNITLGTFKDLVSVHMAAGTKDSAKFFGNSVGVMGSYGHGKNGNLLARDGVTAMSEDDTNKFAEEWQVTDKEDMLFRTARAPQFPQKCILPSPEAASGRRLGETIAKQAAEKACAHVSDQKNFANCVFDVMAVGDMDIAENYGSTGAGAN